MTREDSGGGSSSPGEEPQLRRISAAPAGSSPPRSDRVRPPRQTRPPQAAARAGAVVAFEGGARPGSAASRKAWGRRALLRGSERRPEPSRRRRVRLSAVVGAARWHIQWIRVEPRWVRWRGGPPAPRRRPSRRGWSKRRPHGHLRALVAGAGRLSGGNLWDAGGTRGVYDADRVGCGWAAAAMGTCARAGVK